ncbi:MAG: L-threonylcarbamoyladenylate synthase [Gammaproteobacteria bacterium]|nr:L-threonylcarbamoyladenylate synthase [Gammaproteobacteria bacterium]
MSQVTTDIQLVVSRLREGGVAAIPTETVYGLAAVASQIEAVTQVFALKQRPMTHPLIVHVSPTFDVSQLVSFVSDDAACLMKHFWPGPLTLVFRRNPTTVLDVVTAAEPTVAIRCPAHPLAQQVLTALGEPLVAPSANRFGRVSPTTAQHVQNSFKDEPVLILDGGRCPLGIESTIVSVLEPQGYQLLRPGAIEEGLIQAQVTRQTQKAGVIKVSGGLKQHYQPRKPLYCFETLDALLTAYQGAKESIFVLAFESSFVFPPDYFYRLPSDPMQVAYELYYQLHLADVSDAASIFVQLPPAEARWAGVRDRVMKAARS